MSQRTGRRGGNDEDDATATKGALAAGAGSGFCGFWLTPVLHFFLAIAGVKLQLNETSTARERRFVIKLLLSGMALVAVITMVPFITKAMGLDLLALSPFVPSGLMVVFGLFWIPLCCWGGKQIKKFRVEAGLWVDAQPVTGTGPDQLSTRGVVWRFAVGILATTIWLGALSIYIGDWINFAFIAAMAFLAFTIGTSFCLLRPNTWFKSMALSAGLPAFVAILVTGHQLGGWSGSSTRLPALLLPALGLTTTSMLVVNLLAWKRDAKMRRSEGGK